MTLHCDFETRSVVQLGKQGGRPGCGANVYFEHETTRPWCMAYAFGDGPVDIWIHGEPCPPVIVDHIKSGQTLTAWNANFERLCFKHIMGPRYGWPVPSTTQWRCVMAMSYAMAFPGKLEHAAPAIGIEIAKDMIGSRLAIQMGSPRRRDPLTWWDDEERLQRLYTYCKQDVEVERAVERRLVPLSKSEQELWWLDQAINDRGVFVDVPLCEAAIKIVDQCKRDLDAEMSKVTGTGVTACTNRNQLVIWLKEQGIDAESVAKDALAEMLARSDLPGPIRRALELRREGSKTSVAKVDALLAGRSRDGRAKGLTQYHAASTGRWGGRRFQPQNLKRPEEKDIETLVALLATGDYGLFNMMYGDGA